MLTDLNRKEESIQEEHKRTKAATRRERERVRKEVRAEERVRKLFGRVASGLGIAVALVGGLTTGDLGAAGPAGIVLGALGWVLGARRIGSVALMLSVVEILSGIAID